MNFNYTGLDDLGWDPAYMNLFNNSVQTTHKTSLDPNSVFQNLDENGFEWGNNTTTPVTPSQQNSPTMNTPASSTPTQKTPAQKPTQQTPGTQQTGNNKPGSTKGSNKTPNNNQTVPNSMSKKNLPTGYVTYKDSRTGKYVSGTPEDAVKYGVQPNVTQASQKSAQNQSTQTSGKQQPVQTNNTNGKNKKRTNKKTKNPSGNPTEKTMAQLCNDANNRVKDLQAKYDAEVKANGKDSAKAKKLEKALNKAKYNAQTLKDNYKKFLQNRQAITSQTKSAANAANKEASDIFGNAKNLFGNIKNYIRNMSKGKKAAGVVGAIILGATVVCGLLQDKIAYNKQIKNE